MSAAGPPQGARPPAGDFFAAQEHARRLSRRLVVMFALALVVILAAVNLMALLGWVITVGAPRTGVPTALFATTSIVTLCIIGVVSLFRIVQLAGGGEAIARMVSARRIEAATAVPAERRLTNIVEEMAIASGIAVPQCYVLDREGAINAFVAGYSPNHAVVVVTRGALEALSREELQAVIAHEYSHILNGDMRLNVWMIGLLAGILAIGQLGLFIMREAPRTESVRATLAMVVGGGILAAIGYIGVFAGRLIKAAMSRQREFLADSAAVQFTRNPEALAVALHKIRSQPRPNIEGWYAEELSHMFFGGAHWSEVDDWMATHPPVLERMRRVMPGFTAPGVDSPTMRLLRDWIERCRAAARDKSKDSRPGGALQADGTLTPAAASPVLLAAASPVAAAAATEGSSATLQARLVQPAAVVRAVGQPSHADVTYASDLLRGLPDDVKQAFQSTAGARAIVYGMLVSCASGATEESFALIERDDGAEGRAAAEPLARTLTLLPRRVRFALLDLVTPVLRTLPPSDRDRFLATTAALACDDIAAFALQVLVEERLRPGAGRRVPVRHATIADVVDAARTLLAILARAGAPDDARALAAFAAGAQALGLPQPPGDELPGCDVARMKAALLDLQALAPLQKPKVMLACAACALADRSLADAEVELMRAFGAAIDCPLPPLLAAPAERALYGQNADGTSRRAAVAA